MFVKRFVKVFVQCVPSLFIIYISLSLSLSLSIYIYTFIVSFYVYISYLYQSHYVCIYIFIYTFCICIFPCMQFQLMYLSIHLYRSAELQRAERAIGATSAAYRPRREMFVKVVVKMFVKVARKEVCQEVRKMCSYTVFSNLFII